MMNCHLQMFAKWLHQQMWSKTLMTFAYSNKCIWLQGSCNGIIFVYMKDQQKAEIAYKVNDEYIKLTIKY
jgi:hypothetical protein